MVPNPPGNTISALAICANHSLRMKEIMKIKAEFVADIAIGKLLVRQLDAQTNGFAAGFRRAAIGGLHNAGSSARANDETAWMIAKRHRPGSDTARQFARVFVIGRHAERVARYAEPIQRFREFASALWHAARAPAVPLRGPAAKCAPSRTSRSYPPRPRAAAAPADRNTRKESGSAGRQNYPQTSGRDRPASERAGAWARLSSACNLQGESASAVKAGYGAIPRESAL